VGWNYFTRKRGARLITGEDSLPVGVDANGDYYASNSKSALKV